ncbi:MAG: alpha/beta fold hydrolase [Alphaproteobacteria bacterium]|nr:alpha/beta fold hydrolase [Alphaproteobacteria bacterium]MBU1515799.1 alpha/beta fold hydrolase [Alphaproteobacteria bacterium]MBU2094021.1 alpha/beta fold hydrolase [Alphaproteobacteria bacterium]MBU2152620.1 alpha/beta fold hydrolase [Alphaproteobacteria bacterium]MBU2308833.1 alpha/beta fold hydrolase [Alphaproteobacteria bacterium]
MARAKANGIELEYEVTGPADGAPLLLIMGLGAQMTRWPEAFVAKLAARGLRVIRFDNRDVGLSSKLDAAGLPDFMAMFTALGEGRKPDVPYLLDDMAADAVGLLDALGIARAHIVGASLGGMVAQLVAADYPDRTLSLTSIMSTTGNRALPLSSPEAMAVLNDRGPDPTADLEGYLDHALKGAVVVGSPGYPFDAAETRERLRADFQRSYSPSGFQRQYAAAAASPDRRPKLATITAPTVVIHGAADALVPLAGGQDTAANIPGAELIVIDGMGHDFPPPLFDTVADGILKAVDRAKANA